jgi:hypothetical protein
MDFTSYQQALWLFIQPVLLFLLGLRVVLSIITGLSTVARDMGSWLKEHL